jgi:hypothetical protein
LVEADKRYLKSGAGGRADGGVLAPKEFLRFGGPRHQLRVEAKPIRFERAPQSDSLDSVANPVEKLRFEIGGVKETASCARVADADALTNNSETFAGDVFVAAEDYDGTGAHVFFFADDSGDALMAIVREGFSRMFEKSRLLAGFRRRHGGRKIDKPFGIDGEAAHDFERGHGVFLRNSDAGMEARSDEALAGDVFEVEKIVEGLLRAKFGSGGLRVKRLHRRVVSPGSGNRDEFLFGIAESCEPAAEDAAGVDVNGAIEPFGFGNGSVTVDDHRGTAIVSRPVVADGEAEFVDFAGGFAEESEVADFA